MIQHTVAFRLKHPAGSAEERDFLRSTEVLATIPSVRDFKCLRQIGKKNGFTFGLTMEFETAEDYDAYAGHPLHGMFVQERWIPEVEEFMEIDYAPYTEFA